MIEVVRRLPTLAHARRCCSPTSPSLRRVVAYGLGYRDFAIVPTTTYQLEILSPSYPGQPGPVRRGLRAAGQGAVRGEVRRARRGSSQPVDKPPGRDSEADDPDLFSWLERTFASNAATRFALVEASMLCRT